MSRWLLGLVMGVGAGWGAGRVGHPPASTVVRVAGPVGPIRWRTPLAAPPTELPVAACPAPEPDRAEALRLPWPEGDLGDGEPDRFEQLAAEAMEACGGQVVMTDCVEYPCFAIVEGDVAGCGATEGLEGVVTSWVPCPDGEDVAIQVLLGDLQSAVVHAQPEGGMFEFLPDLARIGGRRLDDAVYASLDRCR